MTAITLRPITPDDEEFLRQVYASTREEELALTDWDTAQKAAFVQMQFAAQHRYYQENYRQTTFDVILVDGQPAGRLYVARWAKQIRIVDIALLPEYRNAEIGSALLHELMAEAAAAGKPVSIHVERYNPALRLYTRLGFVPIGEHGVYFLLEWTPGTGRADPT
jgi:ribosomal protein S18 acetylase RimI-like enzyme